MEILTYIFTVALLIVILIITVLQRIEVNKLKKEVTELDMRRHRLKNDLYLIIGDINKEILSVYNSVDDNSKKRYNLILEHFNLEEKHTDEIKLVCTHKNKE